ncbi:MAG: FAD:protein FMN transferase [Polyangiaceae bacterium]|nr:FAD:protein FMN transferase [Polyangiaceae bacterium]
MNFHPFSFCDAHYNSPMAQPMTPRRLLTLLSGIAVLAALSWWRLEANTAADASDERNARQGQNNPAAEQEQLLKFQGQVMGTTWTVKALALPDEYQALQALLAKSLQSIDEAMTTYQEESELSRLNRSPAKIKVKVSPELFTVLQLAQEIHQVSQGAFDPSVGPLVNAWGFGPTQPTALPTDEELAQLRARTGYVNLVLDAHDSTAFKMRDDLSLDLSAIAKGYGTDQAARALEKEGIRDYMVEVGGEVRVSGKKPLPGGQSKPWVLGIEAPSVQGRRLWARLELAAPAALATSGDYRNFRETGGTTISHTIDPRTGRPVPRLVASVSVIQPSAAKADALATALSVLSIEEGLALAEENAWPVYILERGKEAEAENFTVHQSSAMKSYRLIKLPTARQ